MLTLRLQAVLKTIQTDTLSDALVEEYRRIDRELGHSASINIMPIQKGLMAGRSPKDRSPRNTPAWCRSAYPKKSRPNGQTGGKASEHKTVSVWLRAQLQELLTTA